MSTGRRTVGLRPSTGRPPARAAEYVSPQRPGFGRAWPPEGGGAMQAASALGDAAAAEVEAAPTTYAVGTSVLLENDPRPRLGHHARPGRADAVPLPSDDLLPCCESRAVAGAFALWRVRCWSGRTGPGGHLPPAPARRTARSRADERRRPTASLHDGRTSRRLLGLPPASVYAFAPRAQRRRDDRPRKRCTWLQPAGPESAGGIEAAEPAPPRTRPPPDGWGPRVTRRDAPVSYGS
jgi:hypothetical protein